MASRPVRFLYTGIRVRDLDRSIRFYRTLGLRVRLRGRMAHGGEYVHLAQPRSAQRLELNWYPKGNPYDEPFRRGTELDHLGFRVDDVRKWVRKLGAAGGTVTIPTFRDGDFQLAYVEDPDGILVELFGPRRRR